MKSTPPYVEVEITSEGMVKLTQPSDSGVKGCLVLHPDDLWLIFERLGFLSPPVRSRRKRGGLKLEKCPRDSSQNKAAAFALPEDDGTGRPNFELTISE